MTGVDLTAIDGIDGFTALKVVSERGLDMTKWANAKYLETISNYSGSIDGGTR